MAQHGIMERTADWLGRGTAAYRQIAGIYYDSLRDNFCVDPEKGSEAAFAALKVQFAALDRNTTELSPLFAMESELYSLVSGPVLISRLSTVLDRFERVVPAATRTNYWRSVKPLGDPDWDRPVYVRPQVHALLDLIHVNYMVNFARETISVRLRLLGLFALVSTASVLLAVGIVMGPFTLFYAYLLLFSAGVVGATISFNRRIENAVAHDALTVDGMFALFSMHTSKAGAIVSLLFGGVFALVLYLLVMSGTLSLLIPSAQSTGDLQSAIGAAESEVARKTAALAAVTPKPAPQTPGAAPTTNTGTTGTGTTGTGTTTTGTTSTDQQTTSNGSAATSSTGQTGASPPAPAVTSYAAAADALVVAKFHRDRLVDLQRSLIPTPQCPADNAGHKDGRPDPNSVCGAGAQYARFLGFPDARSFYLMLLLALVAGFAERLVPDALDRLGKRLGAAADKF